MRVMIFVIIIICIVIALSFIFLMDKFEKGAIIEEEYNYNQDISENETIGENRSFDIIGTTETLNEEFTLESFGIDIDKWNKETNLAGDLVFTKKLLFEDENIINEWVFVEFGLIGQMKRDSSNGNIEYWFHVPLGTGVRAPVRGRVEVIFLEHTNDWGVNIYPSGSDFIVSFEHIVGVKVNNGDIISSGDLIGKAAPRKTFNNEVAMVELAVWKGGQGVTKYCPFDFLDESLKLTYEEKLNRLASDWEEFIGKDVYAEQTWVSPGCLVREIVEK